jgi:hypothetical protein
LKNFERCCRNENLRRMLAYSLAAFQVEVLTLTGVGTGSIRKLV